MVQISEFLKIFCQVRNGLENLTRFGKNVNFRYFQKYLTPSHDAYQMKGNLVLIILDTFKIVLVD